MNDFGSTFYQGFLSGIAIGRLPLTQTLETLHRRYYQKATTNDVATDASSCRRSLQLILIYTKSRRPQNGGGDRKSLVLQGVEKFLTVSITAGTPFISSFGYDISRSVPHV
jgi:hypothetical protein